MSGFSDALSNFLTELRNNVLMELSDSNPEYTKISAQKRELSERLHSVMPFELMDDYFESQIALSLVEVNYSFLCGMRDGLKDDIISPTGEAFLQELSEIEKYRHLEAQSFQQHKELQDIIPAECRDLLTQYEKSWDTMTGLEKHYCYSGGVLFGGRLDKLFKRKNGAEWQEIISIFL